MVKGISKRVVVVKSPDSAIFEEAIFIVKEDGAGGEDILKEAGKVAERYLKTGSGTGPDPEQPWLMALSGVLGALLVGACWLIAAIVGL